jgi:hypothetical protein
MSTSEAAEGGRNEPIDVEWEPAEKRRPERRARRAAQGGDGIGFAGALILSMFAAVAGGIMGAVGGRSSAFAPVLDQIGPGPSVQTAAAPGGALEQRIATLEKSVQTVETASASASPNSILALQQSLQALQGRIGEADLAAMSATVTQVKADVDVIREQAASASQAARAAFAVAAAAEAARSSEPFESALATLEGVLPGNADVAALAPLAKTGAPSRQELKEEFSSLRNQIITQARISNAGTGFWGRVQAYLAQFVVVRRTGETNTPTGFVERADARLKNDDLAGAVAELNRLTGSAAQVSAPWLQKARNRLEIDARLAAVRAELSRRG